MKQYKKLIKKILKEGVIEKDRTGTGTIGIFGHQSRYDLRKGFPLVTIKETNLDAIVHELLWFLKGDTNIKYLVDRGVNIWNKDAHNYYVKRCKNKGVDPVHDLTGFIDTIKNDGADLCKHIREGYHWGDCGKQYGWLWRSWETGEEYTERDGHYPNGEFKWKIKKRTIDQVSDLIEGLKNNPIGRRHIISAWNPATISDMALPACHSFVQFKTNTIPLEERYARYFNHTSNDNVFHEMDEEAAMAKLDELGVPRYFLSCQLYQRSADTFLGVPFNIASYALLTHMVAQVTNMVPHTFIHTLGDAHLYLDHLDQAREAITREEYPLPQIKLNPLIDNIDSFKFEDIQLVNYKSHPRIKAKQSS